MGVWRVERVDADGERSSDSITVGVVALCAHAVIRWRIVVADDDDELAATGGDVRRDGIGRSSYSDEELGAEGALADQSEGGDGTVQPGPHLGAARPDDHE